MGNSDNGNDGFDRGLFSRIIVNYNNPLDNGLEVGGLISYQVNQRDGSATGHAPDVLQVSAGGGFGTVTFGSHAMALCSLHSRTLGLVPSGANTGHSGAFAAAGAGPGSYAEDAYCTTPMGVSYATPSIGGFSAMVSFAPHTKADQGLSLGDAVKDADNVENRFDAAVRFSTSMGGADIAVDAGLQTGEDDGLDSTVFGGQASFGGITVGADWVTGKDDREAYNIGAKYTLGNLTPGIVYSRAEKGDDEASFLTVAVSYALGGGMTLYGEYQDIEAMTPNAADKDFPGIDDDTVLLGGVQIAF